MALGQRRAGSRLISPGTGVVKPNILSSSVAFVWSGLSHSIELGSIRGASLHLQTVLVSLPLLGVRGFLVPGGNHMLNYQAELNKVSKTVQKQIRNGGE